MFARDYLDEVRALAERLDSAAIEMAVDHLCSLREAGGRLFILGVGGSAANASHAANDFRKVCGIECYGPTDNVSELTARTNDEGWATVFVAWLRGSRLSPRDAILVLSVGGGSLEHDVSANIVYAVQYAKEIGATVIGIVGRDGGFTARVGDSVVVIPTVNQDHVTPHTEAFQAIVWHLFVSHPRLKLKQTKWESATVGISATVV
jgi:D-sedoheptulose 7-phosphate isomerase